MPKKKASKPIIAVCVQEPFEDGSCMDLGAIKGDELRFLHQAFITDTINHALMTDEADVRLYYIDSPDRLRFVRIILDYIAGKATGKHALAFKERFTHTQMEKERWGLRIEKVFDDCFSRGYDSVLVIGSRTPTITAKMMSRALRMLSESDAVFGPTPEGRYYEIGMSGGVHIHLSEFDWKSPRIYSDVAQAFTDQGLAWSELEIWYAVETPDDIDFMVRDINQYRFEGDEHTARETEIVMSRFLSGLG